MMIMIFWCKSSADKNYNDDADDEGDDDGDVDDDAEDDDDDVLAQEQEQRWQSGLAIAPDLLTL